MTKRYKNTIDHRVLAPGSILLLAVLPGDGGPLPGEEAAPGLGLGEGAGELAGEAVLPLQLPHHPHLHAGHTLVVRAQSIRDFQ